MFFLLTNETAEHIAKLICAEVNVRKGDFIAANLKLYGGYGVKQDTVMKFVEAINTQNMPLIIDMMSEDFHFIDTYGNKENKEQMKTGWKGYFDWFPDYLIEVLIILKVISFL